MGDGLDDSLVQSEGGFDEVFSIAGGRTVDNADFFLVSGRFGL